MVSLSPEPPDAAACRDAVATHDAGAVIVFEGTARATSLGREVLFLEYETWPEMAIPVLRDIRDEAMLRWHGARVAISHRTGRVEVGETSVVVAVSAPHRAEAYAASRYCIDELKTRAPIWMKEHFRDGAEWKANDP